MSAGRRLDEGALLWEPSAAFREASTMTDYMRWLDRERGLRFEDYAALWRWSVDDLEGFWTSVVDYYDIPLRGDRHHVLCDRTMPGARWFEGAEPPGPAVRLGTRSAPGDERRRVRDVGRGGGGGPPTARRRPW